MEQEGFCGAGGWVDCRALLHIPAPILSPSRLDNSPIPPWSQGSGLPMDHHVLFRMTRGRAGGRGAWL